MVTKEAIVTIDCQWITIVAIESPLSPLVQMAQLLPLPPYGDPGQYISI